MSAACASGNTPSIGTFIGDQAGARHRRCRQPAGNAETDDGDRAARMLALQPFDEAPSVAARSEHPHAAAGGDARLIINPVTATTNVPVLTATLTCQSEPAAPTHFSDCGSGPAPKEGKNFE